MDKLVCEDLMIGDWVEFISKYGYGKGQIAGIEPREGDAEPTTFTILKKDNEGKTLLFVGVRRACVRPIPLTTEILEKNGFENVGQDVYQIEIKPYWIWWEADRCRLGIDIDESSDEENFGKVLRLPVTEIHQLQHALKLCGIKKEIVID